MSYIFIERGVRMNKEINTIIANLEGCIGMFDYLLTPTESNLLVSYIEELQQENKKINGAIQTYDILLKANVEENKQLKEELECTIGIVEHNRIISEKNKEIHQLKRIIKENTILVKDEYGDYQECNINPLRMKQKYEKQVDNWNKLKAYIKTEIPEDVFIDTECFVSILDKMQQLEQGSDSSVKD